MIELDFAVEKVGAYEYAFMHLNVQLTMPRYRSRPGSNELSRFQW